MPGDCFPSKQESYAANLRSALGTAILNPVPYRKKSGRVGDVGFFHADGSYEWFRNAFHTDVDSNGDIIPNLIRPY